jgi:hypothetical protein
VDDTPEVSARLDEYKWQPLRSERRDFTKRGGLLLGGDTFRLYARLYGRDMEQFDYHTNAEIPAVETAFVVTFSDGSSDDGIYDSVAATLGNFVESAVVDQDIEVQR